MKVKVSVTQSCLLTLCDPMNYSPPDSSVHGILQARTLEWVVIPFSRGSSWPRDQTKVPCIVDRFFTVWATREDFTWHIINYKLCFALYECSIMSDSLWPHGRWPARFLCPWNSPGKNTGESCHFLLQRILLTHRLNLHFLGLLQ